MQITGSHVVLEAQHQSSRVETRSASLEVWQGERPTPDGQISVSDVLLDGLSPELLSGEAASLSGAELREDAVAEKIDDLKIRILAMLLARLTGEELDIFEPEDLELDEEAMRDLARVQRVAERTRENGRQGWGAIYTEHHTLEERESLAFRAKGRLHTEDNREIDFDVELKLDRRLFRESSTELRLGDARLKDPLVLDFGAPASRLPGTTFSFDLDMDGSPDDVPMLSQGSAFLVHDKNGNGVADDGSELFGPTSGRGFGELATLDHDGNGFIDAGDPAWSRLRIWEQTPSGDRLVGLGARGVGALYVGSVTSPFAMQGPGGETLGQMRETGVWIGRDGSASTIRQIDLAV